MNYSTYDLGLVVVFDVISHWRYFLLGHQFELHSDHCSLQYIFTQLNLNTQQYHWMEFLCEYEFDVHYIKGKKNIVVDSLSRRMHEILVFTLV